MAETLRLFVSATADLEAERSIVATTLASLPAHNKVEIRRTPVRGDTYDNIFENIANCDRVFFLMGQDITAPAGQEWYLALDLERHIIPLRKEGPMTPAGRSFLHGTTHLPWQVFRTAGGLEQIVGTQLVRILLHPRNRYGLTWNERALLQAHRFAGTEAESIEPGGAEGGGILLDERDPDTVIGAVLDPEDEF